MKKRILVANDDGYSALGLERLVAALQEFADVTVFAPEVNHSGASNSLTLSRPLSVRKTTNGFHCINGTPSDCVHVALTGIMHERPDLVVAGINNGANLGQDTLYSGTVAAATEGYLFGIPSVAFSLTERNWVNLDAAVEVAVHIVQQLLLNPPAKPLLLNVNIPPLEYHDPANIQVTRLGKRHPSQAVVPTQNPQGDTVYWIGAVGELDDYSANTDFNAIHMGHVTITPLDLDLTDFKDLELIREWIVAHV